MYGPYHLRMTLKKLGLFRIDNSYILVVQQVFITGGILYKLSPRTHLYREKLYSCKVTVKTEEGGLQPPCYAYVQDISASSSVV